MVSFGVHSSSRPTLPSTHTYHMPGPVLSISFFAAGLPEAYYKLPERFYDNNGSLLVLRHELERCTIKAKSKSGDEYSTQIKYEDLPQPPTIKMVLTWPKTSNISLKKVLLYTFSFSLIQSITLSFSFDTSVHPHMWPTYHHSYILQSVAI